MPRPSAKEKILSSAVDTLHARGFNGASVSDIMDAASVAKGSFFNHYATKEALALEVLERYGNNSRMEMLFDKSKLPLERLRGHFVYLADSYEAFGFERGCLLGNFASEMSAAHPPVRDLLKSMFAFWCGAVTDILREAAEQGQIDRSIDADRLGNFIVNAWEGVALRMKVVRNRTPANDFMALCFDDLLRP